MAQQTHFCCFLCSVHTIVTTQRRTSEETWIFTTMFVDILRLIYLLINWFKFKQTRSRRTGFFPPKSMA